MVLSSLHSSWKSKSSKTFRPSPSRPTGVCPGFVRGAESVHVVERSHRIKCLPYHAFEGCSVQQLEGCEKYTGDHFDERWKYVNITYGGQI